MKEVYDVYYNGIEFYHTFYIDSTKKSISLWDFSEENNSIIIKGQWNHNPIANDILEVFNFSGVTVLDVGCRDGFYCFLAEKHDNIVTGVDQYDSPARLFMSKHLNSKMDFVCDNINLLQKWNKTFDVLIVGDVLLHLENPLGVLKVLRKLTNKKIIIISDYFDNDEPYVYVQPVIHTPYKFTIKALSNMLTMSGFESPEISKKLFITNESSVYKYDNRNICILTSETNKNYQFNPFFCSYSYIK